MSEYSAADLVGSWIDDALADETRLSKEQFRYHVSMMPVPTPTGDAIVWVLLITLPSPLLGQDALGSTAKIQANLPPEVTVRQAVKEAVASLRQVYRKKLAGMTAGSNGNALPPGLQGLKL